MRRRMPPLDPAVEVWVNQRLLAADATLDPMWREAVLGGTTREVFEANAGDRRRITLPVSVATARLLSHAAEEAGMDRTLYLRHVIAAHFARLYGGDPQSWLEQSYGTTRQVVTDV